MATDRNLSAVLHGKFDLRLEEMPITEPSFGEVKVAIHSVGLCGTDIHNWQNGYLALEECKLTSPMILGHESSGRVVALGKGVTKLDIGDRVAVHPVVACLRCDYCKEGKASLCQSVSLSTVMHGHFTRFCVVSEDFCYKLPDHVTFEEGAMLEPFVVGVYACERAEVKPGSTVLIIGAGTIGAMCLLASITAGASFVLVADIYQDKLRFAKKLGATATYHLQCKDAKSEARKIEEIIGRKPDCTLECRGKEGGIATGIFVTKPGGCVALIGLPQSVGEDFPLAYAFINHIDIKQVFRYGNCYKRSLDLISCGRVDLKPLVSRRYPLENTLKAFQDLSEGKVPTEGVKVIIDCHRK